MSFGPTLTEFSPGKVTVMLVAYAPSIYVQWPLVTMAVRLTSGRWILNPLPVNLTPVTLSIDRKQIHLYGGEVIGSTATRSSFPQTDSGK